MGSVCLLQGEGTNMFKLGWTGGDVKARKSKLQTGCPHRLHTVLEIKGCTQEHEAAFHKLFEHKQINGEWFDLSAEDIQYLQSYVYCDLDRVYHQVDQLTNSLRTDISNLASVAPSEGQFVREQLESLKSLKSHLKEEFDGRYQTERISHLKEEFDGRYQTERIVRHDLQGS